MSLGSFHLFAEKDELYIRARLERLNSHRMAYMVVDENANMQIETISDHLEVV
jgi:hypothetical protein